MTDRPEADSRPLARALGVVSLALGVPAIAAPETLSRLVGVDDSATSSRVVSAVGYRELVHAVTLLVGSPTSVWTRVAGDVVDLALLGQAIGSRSGERRSRVTITTGVVAVLTAVDLLAALRARGSGQHGRGRPGPLQANASITVRRSPREVYDYWRDLENLPTFMGHLRSVTEDGGGRSTWTANAPIRKSVRWQAEMTGDVPGQRISWKSLPGGDVSNSGTVHFAPTPDGEATEVRVRLHYDVPGGAVGCAVAKLWGEEPTQQVNDDLRRFKQILETGSVVVSDALPHGADSGHQLSQRPARPSKNPPTLASSTAGRDPR